MSDDTKITRVPETPGRCQASFGFSLEKVRAPKPTFFIGQTGAWTTRMFRLTSTGINVQLLLCLMGDGPGPAGTK